MIANYDKTISVKNNADGEIVAIIIHDTSSHKKTFYKVEEMSMDDLLEMINKPNI